MQGTADGRSVALGAGKLEGVPSVPSVLMQDHDFLPTLLLRGADANGVRFELIPDIRTLDLASRDIVAAELSFARHLVRVANGDRSWVAIPAFVQRAFTHRSWYVRRDSPYWEFRQLAGKKVGISEWGATGNTWARAAARDGGLDVPDVEWVVGPIEEGGYVNRSDQLPSNARYFDGASLTAALHDGTIDALVTPDPPLPFYEEHAPARRLLADYQTAERSFFERTGVLPGHHIVGVKREFYDSHPDIVTAIFNELVEAKLDFARGRLADGDTSPWLLADLEDAMRLIGPDWRPFGTKRNEAMIAYLCREMYAQRLLASEVAPAVVFGEFDSLGLEGG